MCERPEEPCQGFSASPVNPRKNPRSSRKHSEVTCSVGYTSDWLGRT